MGLELRQLRYLLAVAEAGSFSGAARRLRLSQPTLSLAVAQLERHLGGRLLERGSRGLTLTPAGVAAVQRSRRVLEAVRELEDDVRPLVARQAATLRVGLFAGGVGALTVALLQALPGRVPGLRLSTVHLGTDQLVTPLLAAEVDLTLGWGPLDDDRLRVESLFTEPRVVVVGASNPLADAPAVSAADLLDSPHAGALDGEPRPWESWWNLVPERGGEQPRRLAAPESADPVSQLRGHALRPTVATVPAHVAGAFPGRFLGIRYLPAPTLAPATAVVITPARRSPLVEAVVHLAGRLARELAP